MIIEIVFSYLQIESVNSKEIWYGVRVLVFSIFRRNFQRLRREPNRSNILDRNLKEKLILQKHLKPDERKKPYLIINARILSLKFHYCHLYHSVRPHLFYFITFLLSDSLLLFTNFAFSFLLSHST